jgi:hypothetical protein
MELCGSFAEYFVKGIHFLASSSGGLSLPSSCEFCGVAAKRLWFAILAVTFGCAARTSFDRPVLRARLRSGTALSAGSMAPVSAGRAPYNTESCLA